MGCLGASLRVGDGGLYRLCAVLRCRRCLHRPLHLGRVLPRFDAVARSPVERPRPRQEALCRLRRLRGNRLPRTAADHPPLRPRTVSSPGLGGHGLPQHVQRLCDLALLQHLDRQRRAGEYPRALCQPPNHRQHHSSYDCRFRDRPIPRPFPRRRRLCLGLCRRVALWILGLLKPPPRPLSPTNGRHRRTKHALARPCAALLRRQLPPRRALFWPVDLWHWASWTALQRLHARPPADLLYRGLDFQRPVHADQHRWLPALGWPHRPLRCQTRPANSDDAGRVPASYLDL